MSIVNSKLLRYKELKTMKEHWAPLWQKCGEYIHTRKQEFTSTDQVGAFLNEELFDTTAPKANRKMAASLVGNLWPNGGKSSKLKPVRGLKETEAVKNYFEKINEVYQEAVNDPNAGFVLALEEYLSDQGAFGTSGLFCDDNPSEESELVYAAWGIDECCLEEGVNGKIDTIYREFSWKVSRVVREYGINNVSKKVRECYQESKFDEKVKILHVIEPRENNPKRKGNEAMPYASIHIEIDNKKLLRESGFEEKPANFGRFFKKRGEVYGRSPGMDALPDILELNATREGVMIAREKNLDPPMAIENDGILGGGSLDTSASAVNVLNLTGRAQSTANPIFPLHTVGEMHSSEKSIEELKISVNEHFNIDRLLDFNNQTEMTLGETQIRAGIRATALGSLFIRQIYEVITPTLERTVSKLFRKDMLGYFSNDPYINEAEGFGLTDLIIIPEEVEELIKEGKDFYNIGYDTPAARMMQAEESSGVIRVWEFAAQIGEMQPEIYDNLDADKSLKIIAESSAAPASIMIAIDKRDKIREKRLEQLEEQQKMQKEQLELGQLEQAAKIKQSAEPQNNENQEQERR